MAEDFPLRQITPEEYDAYVRFVDRGFFEEVGDEDLERWRSLVDWHRFYAITDPAGEYAASAGAFEYTISLPHAEPVGCAGVTVVVVRPDVRRRGMLGRMMARMLADAREHEEPFAALFASEGGIYGRYGFGPAVPSVDLEIDRAHARPVAAGDPAAGRFVTAEELIVAAPALHEAARRQRGGMVGRREVEWQAWLGLDTERDRADGWTRRFHYLIPDRGYVVYRGKEDWTDRVSHARLKVEELVALDPRTHVDLWSFLAAQDLVATIEVPHRPPDDPLRHLVHDEARVRDRSNAPLWVRPVDLPAALTARGYAVADRCVLEITDRSLPDNAGRWSLETGPDGAACERTDVAPDVVLDISELATVMLGGVRATTLRDAGRLVESTAAACARLDRMFHVDRLPMVTFEF